MDDLEPIDDTSFSGPPLPPDIRLNVEPLVWPEFADTPPAALDRAIWRGVRSHRVALKFFQTILHAPLPTDHRTPPPASRQTPFAAAARVAMTAAAASENEALMPAVLRAHRELFGTQSRRELGALASVVVQKRLPSLRVRNKADRVVALNRLLFELSRFDPAFGELAAKRKQVDALLAWIERKQPHDGARSTGGRVDAVTAKCIVAAQAFGEQHGPLGASPEQNETRIDRIARRLWRDRKAAGIRL